jgi:glycerol kinase
LRGTRRAGGCALARVAAQCEDAATLAAAATMKYVLALDQGTTSSRAILFDHEGSVRGVAQREFTQHFPAPGQVEHDADEIWATQIGCVSEVLAKTGARATDVVAIGITNQRETVVVWERATGRPIARAIVWQDRRTAGECEALVADGRETFLRERTGLVADPYFSATKLAWLLDHVAGARARAERGELLAGTIDTWLLWKLTVAPARHRGLSNASRTLLFNIHTRRVGRGAPARCSACRASLLPEARSLERSVFGASRRACRSRASRQRASRAISRPRSSVRCASARPHEEHLRHRLLLLRTRAPRRSRPRTACSPPWRGRSASTEYALEGSVFIGGAVVQWLRDGLV